MKASKESLDILSWILVHLYLLVSSESFSAASSLAMTPVESPVTVRDGSTVFTTLSVYVNDTVNPPNFVYVYDPALGGAIPATPPIPGSVDKIYTYIAIPTNYKRINTTITFYVSSSVNGARVVSTEVILMLEALPKVTIQPSLIHKIENDSSLEALCSATGNPPPTISWKYENTISNLQEQDGEFPDPVFISDTTSRKNLTLLANQVITLENSGNYTCEAVNMIENNTVKTNTSEKMKLIVHIPVQFWNKSHGINEPKNDATNLSCTFRAFPPPNETAWNYIGEKEFEISTHVSEEIFTVMTLQLPSVDCETEGIYSCEATNYILNGEKRNDSSAVQIQFPDPPRVTNLEAFSENCDGTSLIVSWDSPQESATTLTYRIWLSSGESNFTSENESIKLPTNTSTTYSVNVVTVSQCNKTSVVSTVNVTTTDITFPNQPEDVRAQNENTVCNVSWREPENNFDNISGYKIFYSIWDDRGNNVKNCSDTTNADRHFYEINMTYVDSEYIVSVSAANCAGEGPRKTAYQTCIIRTNKQNDNELVKILVPVLVIFACACVAVGLYFYLRSNKKKNMKQDERQDYATDAT